MKLTLKKIATLATVMALPCFAIAAPTVQFQGEVTDQTCEVNINGETNSTVLLPTVSMSELKESGAKAGITPFTITLSNCGEVTTEKTITTNFLGHNVTSGVLGNTAEAGENSASNVGIQLLETDTTGKDAIVLSGVTPSATTMTLAANASSVSHTFGAQYYALGTATAGKVTAVAEYTVSYK